VPHDLTVLVEDADVHGPGVPVDATGTLVWRGVEAPEVSSAPWACCPIPAVPPWSAEEGASIRINPVERTAHSVGFLVLLGVVACGPQLTGSVRLLRHQQWSRHFEIRPGELSWSLLF
jgi:hypothetical protein